MEFLPASFLFREFLAILSKEFIPFFFLSSTLCSKFFIMSVNFLRNVKRFFRFRPAQVLFKSFYILLTQRLAMSASFALFSRAAIADLRLNRNEGRMLFISLSSFNSLANSFKVIAIFDRNRLEAEGSHACLNILREGDIRITLDGDFIGIIEDNQFGQAKRASQRERLRRDTFHHAAVATQREGVMVNDFVTRTVELSSQMCLSHCHTNSHTHTCAQRASRSFDTNRMTILWMSRRKRAVLTELFHIIQRQAITKEMKQRIKQ